MLIMTHNPIFQVGELMSVSASNLPNGFVDMTIDFVDESDHEWVTVVGSDSLGRKFEMKSHTAGSGSIRMLPVH
jgi:hypothetical protein